MGYEYITYMNDSNQLGENTMDETSPEQSIIVNNMVKHLSGTEIDRMKQTQILDFIIQKKKNKEK